MSDSGSLIESDDPMQGSSKQADTRRRKRRHRRNGPRSHRRPRIEQAYVTTAMPVLQSEQSPVDPAVLEREQVHTSVDGEQADPVAPNLRPTVRHVLRPTGSITVNKFRTTADTYEMTFKAADQTEVINR